MARYQIICWREIPVQVRVKLGTTRITHPLTPRFQKAVTRAAYRTKAISGDAYLQEWRPSGWQARDGEPQAIAESVAEEIEAAYSDERLDALARNGGREGSPPVRNS